MHNNDEKAGFTLIELICSMLIISVMVAFSGAFIASGVKGFFLNRQASKVALEVRNVMNRVRNELQDMNVISNFVANTRIVYKSDNPILPGNSRTLIFTGNSLFITASGVDNLLLENIETFSLTLHKDDLDHDAVLDDVAYIAVGFALEDVSTSFSSRIYPRNRLKYP